MILPGFYYHVSHVNFLDSIARHGISPLFSQGKRPVCWYVSEGNVRSAMLHVADRHMWLVGQLVILKVSFQPYELQHTAWPMVYTSGIIKHPAAVFGAADFIPKWKEV